MNGSGSYPYQPDELDSEDVDEDVGELVDEVEDVLLLDVSDSRLLLDELWLDELADVSLDELDPDDSEDDVNDDAELGEDDDVDDCELVDDVLDVLLDRSLDEVE